MISTTSVGGPSMPRSLMTDRRATSTNTISGRTTVMFSRMQSTGAMSTFPSPGVDVTPENHEQVPEAVLVAETRPRRHGELSLVQLVATAVVGECCVIFVGQARAGRHGRCRSSVAAALPHDTTPGTTRKCPILHAPAVAASGAGGLVGTMGHGRLG